MKIHVEWSAGVMRLLVHDFGGDYVWSASVVRVDDRLYIKGVSQLPDSPFKLRQLLREWCKDNGVTSVEWERAGKGRRVYSERDYRNTPELIV